MSLRNQQLHYIVFRQTAAHLPHEALIGVNYSTYKPTDEEILARYLLKFSKGGKATAAELHQDDLGLLDPSGDSEGYLVQAASSVIEL